MSGSGEGIRKWWKEPKNDQGKIKSFGSQRPNDKTSFTPPKRRVEKENSSMLSDVDVYDEGFTDYDSYALGRKPGLLHPSTEYNINSQYYRYEKALDIDPVNRVDIPRESEYEHESEYWFPAINTTDQYWKVNRLQIDTFLNAIGKVIYNVLCGGTITIDDAIFETNADTLIFEQRQGSRTMAITVAGDPFPVYLNLQGGCTPGTGCTGTPGEPIIVWVYPEGEIELFQSIFFYTVPTSISGDGYATGANYKDISERYDIQPIQVRPGNPFADGGGPAYGPWGSSYRPPGKELVRQTSFFVAPTRPTNFDALQTDGRTTLGDDIVIQRFEWAENRFGKYLLFTGTEGLEEVVEANINRRIKVGGGIRKTINADTRITDGFSGDSVVLGVGRRRRGLVNGGRRLTTNGSFRTTYAYIPWQGVESDGVVLLGAGGYYKALTRYSFIGVQNRYYNASNGAQWSRPFYFPATTEGQYLFYLWSNIKSIASAGSGQSTQSLFAVGSIRKLGTDSFGTDELVSTGVGAANQTVFVVSSVRKTGTDTFETDTYPSTGTGSESQTIIPLGGIVIG